MSKRSKRGRKPGKETKAYDRSASLEEKHIAAYLGNYSKEVFVAVFCLDYLTKVRKGIRTRPDVNQMLSKAGLPPESSEEFQAETLDSSRFSLYRTMASLSIHPILDAIENRDVRFFTELARRLASIGEDAHAPADPERAALAEHLQDDNDSPVIRAVRRAFGQRTYSTDELRQIVVRQFPDASLSDRTITRAADDLLIKRRGKGRPKP